MSRSEGDAAIEAAIAAALDRRGCGKSLCPSEVARGLAENWRPLVAEIRRVAQDMADRGLVQVTQKGRPVDARHARGPIRLSRPDPQDPG